MYHLLNSQIASELQTLNSSQYLKGVTAFWFESLEQAFEESGDIFDKCVQLFTLYWNELNWCDKALQSFYDMKQKDKYTDIEKYNLIFEQIYQAVVININAWVALCIYILELKPKT